MSQIKRFTFSSRYLEPLLFLIILIILQFEFYDFVNIPFYQKSNGFSFEFTTWRFILGNLLALFFIDLNSKQKDLSYFVNSMFTVFLTFPVLILFMYMPETPSVLIIFLLLFHFLLYFSYVYPPNIKLKKLGLNQTQIVWIISGLTLLMLIPFLLVYGLKINYKVFLFQDIYETRAIASAKSTFITSYFFSWLMKIVVPIGVVLSLKNKKWLALAFFIIVQLYLFSIAAHKSAFFSLFVVLIMVINSYRKQVLALLSLIIIAIIASKIVSITTGDLLAESIVVRRVFFLPAVIINDYFDFFKDHHTYLSYSIFKSFITYPFDLQPPQLIGRAYFMSDTANVNSGFLSDGFMNFGYIGVIINIIAVVGIFRIVQFMNLTSSYSGILLIIIYTLISSFLLTCLLTHGILLFFVLIYFIRE